MESIGFKGRLSGAGVRSGRHLLYVSAPFSPPQCNCMCRMSGWLAHEEEAEQGYLEPPSTSLPDSNALPSRPGRYKQHLHPSEKKTAPKESLSN